MISKVVSKPSKNPLFNDRSKHIKIRYHFTEDRSQKEAMTLQCISTDQLVADALTKSLVKEMFEFFRDRLGLAQNSSLAKREG